MAYHTTPHHTTPHHTHSQERLVSLRICGLPHLERNVVLPDGSTRRMLLHTEETIGELADRLGGGRFTSGGVRVDADELVLDVHGQLCHQPLTCSRIWLKGPTTIDSILHYVSLDEAVGVLLSRLETKPGALHVLRVGLSLDRALSWAAQGVVADDTLGLVGRLDGGCRGGTSGVAGSSSVESARHKRRRAVVYSDEEEEEEEMQEEEMRDQQRQQPRPRRRRTQANATAPGGSGTVQAPRQPLHEALNLQPPQCSLLPLQWSKPDDERNHCIHLLLDSASVPELGSTHTSTAAEPIVVTGGQAPLQVAIEPTRNRLLALEYGTNAGKSHQTHSYIHDRVTDASVFSSNIKATVQLCIRITHSTDLKATADSWYGNLVNGGQGIACYNQKSKKTSVTQHLSKANHIIISSETMAYDVLGENLDRFKGGVLVLDEVHGLALALGAYHSQTIKDPQRVIDILCALVEKMERVIVADRDITLTPAVSWLLAAIAPYHDVLHVRGKRPAQRSLTCYAFDCMKENDAGRGLPLALQRFELHVRRCIRSFYAETVGTLRQKYDGLDAAVRGQLSEATVAAVNGALYETLTASALHARLCARIALVLLVRRRADGGIGLTMRRGALLRLDERVVAAAREALRPLRLDELLTTADVRAALQQSDAAARIPWRDGMVLERGPYRWEDDAVPRLVLRENGKYGWPADAPRYPQSAWITWPFDERGQPAPPLLVRFPWLNLPTEDKAALRLEEPRRVWVTLASRSFYDKHLHGILRGLGVDIGFYYADAPATEALQQGTSISWRDKHVVLSTVHIEVAINVKLSFLCRHWFCENNADFFATVPEQRQNTARVPRGQSAADRDWQLTDPRIYTLIRGKPPTAADVESDRKFQRELPEKTRKFATELKIEGKRLQALAREAEQRGGELYGVNASEPLKSYDNTLNRLRACVAQYKRSHGKERWIALRIFELDLKNGDGASEEMPALTDNEYLEMQGLVTLTPAQLSEEERVRDMNKNDVKKYSWLMEHLEGKAAELVESGEVADDNAALQQVHEHFWTGDVVWKGRDFQAGLPSQHLMRRIFHSLVAFR